MSLRYSNVLRTFLGIYAGISTWLVSRSGALAWDESVFALAGRTLKEKGYSVPLSELPNWSSLRAPGFPYILSLIFRALPASDFVVRMVSVAGSVFLLWVLSRILLRFAGEYASIFGTVIIAFTPGFLLTGTMAFGDNIAASIALFGVLSIFNYVEGRDKRNDAILVVSPLLIGLATVIRYGVPFVVFLPLAVIAFQIWKRSKASGDFTPAWKVSVSIAFAAVMSWVVIFRDPLSAGSSAASARSASTSSPFSKGLSELLATLRPGKVHYGFTGHHWGPIFFVLVVVPLLLGVVYCLLTEKNKFRNLGILVMAIFPMVCYAVLTRLFVVTYASPLVAIAIAVCVVIIFNSDLGSSIVPVHSTAAAKAVLFVLIGASTLAAVASVREEHRGLRGFDGVAEMAQIGGIIGGDSCSIRTQRGPQVQWYSGCRTMPASPSSIGVSSAEEFRGWIESELATLAPGQLRQFVLLENLRNQVEVEWIYSSLEVYPEVDVLEVGKSRRTILVILRA